MNADNEITSLLADLRRGESRAWDRLVPLVYDELRAIAHRQLRNQRSGHTLGTTALVHEAYFKLVGQSEVTYAERAQFFGIAARAMRQVLIDHARRHGTAKRGGRWQRVAFDEASITVEERADLLLALDEALARLTDMNERLARIVECRFFGGMTEAETAAALGITDRTVRRDWTKARLWLYGEMREEGAA
jgi:RNA polymerase sigma-70 factor, ECF subfamily